MNNIKGTSLIQLSNSSIENNVQFLQSLYGQHVRISAVIKGNAYGHGYNPMVQAFENAGISHFSVFSSTEAKLAFPLKKSQTGLMIMGYICESDYEWVIKNKVEFYVSSYYVLQKALEWAQKLKTEALIHLELETGMNRTGLNVSELNKSIKLLHRNKKYFQIVGIASHLAGAESIANYFRIEKQKAEFDRLVRHLKDERIEAPSKHIACSAASVSDPDTLFNMVRVGVLLYGYWPTRETWLQFVYDKKSKRDPLKRVMTWKTQVMDVKKVKSGGFIGYGLGYQAQEDMKIMIIPVGYANGYSRNLSNNGHVLVKKQRADIIGYINMNITICNITHIKNVKQGDEVTLLGQQGMNKITFASFADMNNAMNYEISARLPENIERVLIA